MFFRQLLQEETACASYLFGCKSTSQFAVVDPHVDLVGSYIDLAERQGAQIVAVFETHVQADHVSGLPALVERTGATAYLPAGADVEFEHRALQDCEVVELGNDRVQALATPGHTPAHHAYVVTDTTRGDDPWLVLTGDALLIGDAGRPDLHAHGNANSPEAMARELHHSITARLFALPEHLLVFPAHYAGSVCGRGLSGTPVSTLAFERRHNAALSGDREEFVQALTEQPPPVPDDVEKIVQANRTASPSAVRRPTPASGPSTSSPCCRTS